MSILRTITNGLRGLFRKETVERELDDEVQHYLELMVRERERAGMTRAQAERAARVALGGVEAVKEDVRGGGWESRVEGVWRDLRYGARTLRMQPAFTAMALLTLALGIGANTAMFSVVNTVLLRPLPYAAPHRLAMLWTADVRRGILEEGTGYPTVEDWRAESKTFTALAICSRGHTVPLGGSVDPELVKLETVSANLFPLLGVQPLIGRGFSVDDERRREPVVILGYGLWQRRFGGSRDVIGTMLDVGEDGQAEIIGVMPAGVFFPTKDTQLWAPVMLGGIEHRSRFGDSFRVIGRLAPGATFAEAQREMSAIGRRLSLAYPSPSPNFVGFGVNVVPMLEQMTGRNLGLALWILLGAVGFVLAIACANVGNLLLARGTARAREFAIRAALGAGRARLLRQLLAESMLLSVAGGLLGLALAMLAVRALVVLAPVSIPRLDELRIDSGVLAFTAGASMLAGLLFGLAPAWATAGTAPNDVLKDSRRSSSSGLGTRHLRALLVVAECALAMMLVIGAGLLMRSFARLNAVDRGFQPGGVLLARVAIPLTARERPDGITAVPDIYQEILDRVAALPGVRRVGAISSLLLRRNADMAITIDGGRGELGDARRGQLTSELVSPGFFRTMGVPVRRGRDFERSDVRAQQAAIVNASFAARYFPNADPIGKRFKEGGPADTEKGGIVRWYTIVGVVGDLHRQELEKHAVSEFYLPGTMWWIGTSELVVRAMPGIDPMSLAASIRDVIRSVEKRAIVVSTTLVEHEVEALSDQRRLQTWLLGFFAAAALAMSALGIFGVVHYTVVSRTHEIGIRMALGARVHDVLQLTIGQGMKLALLGVVIGLAGAIALRGVIAHLLFGIGATDATTFAAVAALLAAVAALACVVPAVKAARVDPVVALRHE